MRRGVVERFGDGADVNRRRAAATTRDVEPAVVGKLAHHGGHFLRPEVVLPHLVWQPGVGMATDEGARDMRQFLEVRPHRFRP